MAGGKRRAVARCWVGMAFWFTNFGVLSIIGRAGDGQINRLRIIWVSFRLTDYPNVTIISSKETETEGEQERKSVFLSSRGESNASEWKHFFLSDLVRSEICLCLMPWLIDGWETDGHIRSTLLARRHSIHKDWRWHFTEQHTSNDQ